MLSHNFVGLGRSAAALYQISASALVRTFTVSNLSIFAVLTLGYFAAGKLGQLLAFSDPGAIVLWAPTGISLTAILLRGNRVWPGILLGAFLVNITTTLSIQTSMGIAVGNTLEALGAGYLVTKFADGTNAFCKPWNVLRFTVLAGMVPTALCATNGVSLLCQAGFASWSDFWHLWSVWWVGDLLGAILLTPFLVLLLGHKHHPLGAAELGEAGILLLGLSIVGVLNFGPQIFDSIPKCGLLYMCAPFMAWIALRFCPLEAAGATLVLSGFAIWGSLHGYGPYVSTNGVPYFAVGFVVVASTVTMTIAATRAEQSKYLEGVIGMYYVAKEKSDNEIRTLQDTVESLERRLSEAKFRPVARSTSGGVGK
jgi:integral membrane sensor domain MASE1